MHMYEYTCLCPYVYVCPCVYMPVYGCRATPILRLVNGGSEKRSDLSEVPLWLSPRVSDSGPSVERECGSEGEGHGSGPLSGR